MVEMFILKHLNEKWKWVCICVYVHFWLSEHSGLIAKPINIYLCLPSESLIKCQVALLAYLPTLYPKVFIKLIPIKNNLAFKPCCLLAIILIFLVHTLYDMIYCFSLKAQYYISKDKYIIVQMAKWIITFSHEIFPHPLKSPNSIFTILSFLATSGGKQGREEARPVS